MLCKPSSSVPCFFYAPIIKSTNLPEKKVNRHRHGEARPSLKGATADFFPFLPRLSNNNNNTAQSYPQRREREKSCSAVSDVTYGYLYSNWFAVGDGAELLFVYLFISVLPSFSRPPLSSFFFSFSIKTEIGVFPFLTELTYQKLIFRGGRMRRNTRQRVAISLEPNGVGNIWGQPILLRRGSRHGE